MSKLLRPRHKNMTYQNIHTWGVEFVLKWIWEKMSFFSAHLLELYIPSALWLVNCVCYIIVHHSNEAVKVCSGINEK